jgi:hypothetical protein
MISFPPQFYRNVGFVSVEKFTTNHSLLGWWLCFLYNLQKCGSLHHGLQHYVFILCTDDERVVIEQTDHRVLLPMTINFTCQFLLVGIYVETENWHQCIQKKSISIGPSCNPLMSMLLNLTIIGHYLFAMYASSLCCEWLPLWICWKMPGTCILMSKRDGWFLSPASGQISLETLEI